MPRDNNRRPPKEITKHEEITKRRLRKLRKDSGLTQKEIAEEYGREYGKDVTSQTISNYEKCDHVTNTSPPIPIEYYLFISKKFNKPIDWIMGNDIETEITTNQKEKFETYGEVFQALIMLFNTFESLNIDDVSFYVDEWGYPCLSHPINKAYANKLLSIDKEEVLHINHISIDDYVVNNFLNMYMKQKEFIDSVSDEDEDFKKVQSKAFFEYLINSNKDKKIQ